jgi:hypothetical protein
VWSEKRAFLVAREVCWIGLTGVGCLWPKSGGMRLVLRRETTTATGGSFRPPTLDFTAEATPAVLHHDDQLKHEVE